MSAVTLAVTPDELRTLRIALHARIDEERAHLQLIERLAVTDTVAPEQRAGYDARATEKRREIDALAGLLDRMFEVRP